MFSLETKMESTHQRQRARVDAEMQKALEDKTFTYTELLSADEPVRTMGLEYLDGVVSSAWRPEATNRVVHFEPFRLVQIEGKPIKYTADVVTRVPGTDRNITQTVRREFAADVLVPDVYPDRHARRLLVERGWPILQARSNGLAGDIVEYEWLRKEAAKPDASEEVRALWERLGDKPAPTKASPNKTDKGGAHASP